MINRKLQIFISSTFEDLKDERQAAVEAVLKAGHIPAGMELFKASDRSQMETIKKWINQSDIYMLILGGRYGSIEPESGKSYTHVEYEYAISRNIPFFAVVLKNEYLEKKAKKDANAIESVKDEKYIDFKKIVLNKMVKEIVDLKDIQLAVHESLRVFEDEYTFSGWVPGDLIESGVPYSINSNRKKSITELKNQIKLLNEQIEVLELKRIEQILSKKVAFYKQSFNNGKLDENSTVSLLKIFVFIVYLMKNKRLTKRSLLKKIKNEFGKDVFIVNTDIEKILIQFVDLGLIKEEFDGYIFLTTLYRITDLGNKVFKYIYEEEL